MDDFWLKVGLWVRIFAREICQCDVNERTEVDV